jgi:hypothetical protein
VIILIVMNNFLLFTLYLFEVKMKGKHSRHTLLTSLWHFWMTDRVTIIPKCKLLEFLAVGCVDFGSILFARPWHLSFTILCFRARK